MLLSDAGENFPLHGLIKRTQILRMLKHRIGMFAHDGMLPLAPSRSRIPKTQVSCTILSRQCQFAHLTLSLFHPQKTNELHRPVVNPSQSIVAVQFCGRTCIPGYKCAALPCCRCSWKMAWLHGMFASSSPDSQQVGCGPTTRAVQ